MKSPDHMAMLRAAVAEFGGDAKVSDLPAGPLPDDPYLTRQQVVGQNHTALVMRLGPDGTMKLEVGAKADLDVQRKELAAMYAKRKRRWRETGTDEGRSTQDLQNNPNEALETNHDCD